MCLHYTYCLVYLLCVDGGGGVGGVGGTDVGQVVVDFLLGVVVGTLNHLNLVQYLSFWQLVNHLLLWSIIILLLGRVSIM